jgi:hypothetical protein
MDFFGKYDMFTVFKFWWNNLSFTEERKIWVTANSDRRRSYSWSGIIIQKNNDIIRSNSFHL